MRYSIKSGLPVALATLGSSLAAGNATAQESGVPALDEIVVTAQRREEKLSDVPLSISAFSQENLDSRGVRNIDDIARLTPGITFTRADARNGQAANISIRGIASNAGASTTGIYIDDTPIQVRTIGYSSFSTFPAVFDVDRVEVLRGPQGTLFGAGSEGGTVRFITPQPSFNRTSAYLRSELGNTESGDLSGELGAAVGGPISDTLAYRVSGWFRRDGGTVERVNWSRATRTPTGTTDDNANWQNSVVGRAALTYKPMESLTITPSIYYQKLKLNDTSSYWVPLSDTGDGRFNSGNAVQATSEDRFYLPALKVEWNLGSVSLVSNTSYFNRRNEAINDYTSFEAGIWTGSAFFPDGMFAPTLQQNWQSNVMQEIRLQSADADARFNWVVGAFYSHARQTAGQRVQDTFLPGLYNAATGCNFSDPVIAPPFSPCGPGIPPHGFGQGLASGLYTFVAAPIISRDSQTAVYTQADFKATDKLTLTVGVRASRTKVEAAADYEGPVVGPPVHDSGSQDEKPITPKIGLSYKVNEGNLLYATAAKGFRIGGYNPRVGLPCAPQLANLGLFDSNGAPAAPKLFDSDTVRSYEIGSKNTLANRRVQLASSIYYIDWRNIQQNVALATCGFQFVANLGSATSKGFDVQADIQATDAFNVTVAIGYTDASYDESVRGGPLATAPLISDGDHIPGAPWTGALSAQYGFAAFGGRDSYVRGDYQYQSKQSYRTPGNNPTNGTYVANNVFVPPATNLLSLRAGTKWSMGLDVSLFVNNVFNSHTVLAQSAAAGPVLLLQQSTLRPRTYGLTAMYRY
jgi:outer membrane receptor protein involved in Fe transport